MTDKNEKVNFSAVLTPNRSLSQQGFALLMGFIVVISFASGMVFVSMGAWPVFGFFGLDAALLYWAFKRNFADGEVRELVQVTEKDLVIVRFVPKKPDIRYRFLKNWVTVSLDEDTTREIIGSLTIDAHGKKVEIGAFLGPQERKEFYRVFRHALSP